MSNRDDVLKNCRPESEAPFPRQEYRRQMKAVGA